MTSRLDETLGHLAEARRHSPAVLVAFSGGKDSRCVLDLCLRTFERVEGFFMYFLPDLGIDRERLAYATERGVKMHYTPHWILYRCIKTGLHMPPSYKREDIPEIKLRDVYDIMIAKTGIPIIATGARDADSLWRRRNLTVAGAYEDVVYPIRNWNKWDVQAYLMRRNAMPPGTGRQATGVDLSVHEVIFLHDHYPDDYAKMIKVFPYAEALVRRRDWYGIPGAEDGKGKKKRRGKDNGTGEAPST